MSLTDQRLASNKVRKCAQCGETAMLNITAEEGNEFQCTKCGNGVALWGLKEHLSAIAVGVGMLSLLWADNHLFWLLWQVVINPLKEFPAMLVDGIFAPLFIPLGLIAINILMVGLPVMALAYSAYDIYIRFQNPVVKGADANTALGGHSFKPPKKSQKFTWGEFFRALKFAGIIHIGFIAIAWGTLTFMGRYAFEGVVEGALPGLLLSGGLLFGTRRWLVAIIFVLLLPVSGYIAAILTGQSG